MIDPSGGVMPSRTFVAVVAAGVAVPWSRLLADDPRVAGLTDGTLHYASATVLAGAIRQKRVSTGGWKPPL